jgi:SAM-dependent methyltransferase
MTWNEGYVAEINYTYGFYGELSPLKLALATTLKSVHSPKINQSFNYCELACGRGYSTNLLASAYPHAQFYANDFNPSQIMEAKTLAEEAGTKNVHFFDDSFGEFINQDLPSFDFIVLHGIYSWITPENRQEIVNFIRQKLKVGGLVYISYNTLPGWAAALPLRELMVRQKQHSSQPILESIGETLDFTGKLIEANAGYFTQNPSLKSRYDHLKNSGRNYLAHEYFNREWNCFYFDQVAQELELAKLRFVGSAQVIDSIDILNLSPSAQTLVNQIKDPIYREVIRDYFLNTQFRRDLFARGLLSMTSVEQINALNSIRYALTVPLSAVQLKHKFAAGEVVLQEEIYMAICSTLAQSPLTMGELLRHPDTKQIQLNNLYQALIVLTGLGYIHPAVDDKTCTQRQKSTNGFNRVVQEKAFISEEMNYLASPLIGTGVAVSPLEQMLLVAKSKNEDPVKFIWEKFSSQGKRFVKEGKVLETPEENIAHLESAALEFYTNRFPTLQKLGIK